MSHVLRRDDICTRCNRAQARRNMSAAQRGTCFGTVPSNWAGYECTPSHYIHITDDHLAESTNSHPYDIV